MSLSYNPTMKVKDGYIVDERGKRILFYECDPRKNNKCDKSMCRYTHNKSDTGVGFCAKTPDPKYRKSNGRCFYAVLSEDGVYFGRKYVDW